MAKNKHAHIAHHKGVQADALIKDVHSRIAKIFHSFPKSLTYQWPALAAIAAIVLIRMFIVKPSGSFSLIAIIMLWGVVYTALRHGVRHGLISSAIIVLFNAVNMLPVVEQYTISDSNFRRIVLMALVLPVLALIVGRLSDRNTYLFNLEKEARLKAEESEERMRFMAEAMPQKIFTNAPDGSTLYTNMQWQEYTGLSAEEMEHDGWVDLIHPEDVKDNLKKWQRSLRTGEPFVFEHRLKRHDGEYRWHISRSIAMRDENGDITMWVGSSTDIHDIKTALERELELERTAARLTELNKAKDEFISLASHQLRTPATGAKQYIGMLLEGYAGDLSEEQQRFLQRAYDSNERQITIVNDLLKVARVDAGKVILQKEKTDLTALIRSVLDEQNAKFKEHHQKVTYKPGKAPVVVAIDKGNMRMVLENIIDNASKYTPEHKGITVAVSKAKGKVKISVKDEGVGIGKKDIEKVFHKFSRIENPLSVVVGGSGLGLYWAKKIIDLHEGSIEVTSRPGKGSTFTVILPT